VKIELNVRGICCLRPGVSKLSENIRVISIVDRLLEHSRVFYFHHGGARKIFISSADWMPRNLDKRTELMVPVLDAECRDHLISILRTCMKDTAKSHELTADGTYVRTAASGKHKPCRSQEALYHQSRKASRLSRAEDRTVFQPHRPSKSRKGRKG
jgi:polyphosphate kinase